MLIAGLLVFAAVFTGCKQPNNDKTGSTTASKQTADQAETRPLTSHATPDDVHWFDDAVFLGDSITNMLNLHCANDPDALGKAKFICAPSLGFTNAQWDLNQKGNVHPSYRGKTVLAENCAKVTGANKVFIMLGMNDIGIYGTDGAMDACKTLVEKIQKNSPGVTIYMQSVTPKLTTHEDEVIYNELIRDFDAKLEAYCKKNNFKYLDIYHLVCDENGALRPEFCGDPEPRADGGMGMHFTHQACEKWIDYLKHNV